MTFSRQETKADCAEDSCEEAASADGSHGADDLREEGLESWGVVTGAVVVAADRGFRPPPRQFGGFIPSVVGCCLPDDERLLPRLLSTVPSAPSVWVADEADAADDTGGVKAFGSVLFRLIEVAASLADSEEISSASLLSSFGEVGAVGSPISGVVRKCLVIKSPMAIAAASGSEKGTLSLQ